MARVLVADDALFIREAMKQILEANGHSMVGEAATGEETIKVFAELKPEIVILDITMPGMGGIEALKHIMKMDPKAKVIICSAMGQQSVVAEAIQLGAKNFIVKPFKEKHLIEAISNVTK